MAPVQSVRGITFDVSPERYHVRSRLGQGAFGFVCAAYDVRAGHHVALKKINDAFSDKRSVKYVLRELVLMKHFEENENILSLLDVLVGSTSPQDLYFTVELMESDLQKILHSKQPITGGHVQWIIYQILRGVKCLHSAKVLHRDLKPSNILINANCDVKIGDLGLARGVDASCSPLRKGMSADDAQAMAVDEMNDAHGDEPHAPLTDYVVTRWYRAPELLVGNDWYDEGVDMWSIGCILAECLMRTVLFPGKDYLQQLRLIIYLIGKPTELELARSIDNPAAADFIRALPSAPPTSLSLPIASRMPPGTDPNAIALLSSLLVFETSRRPSAREALEHAYLHELRGVNDEPDAPPADFAFEASTATEADLRTRLWQEIAAFQPAEHMPRD